MGRKSKLKETLLILDIISTSMAIGYKLHEIINSDEYKHLKNEIKNTLNFSEENMKDVPINVKAEKQ